MKSLPKTLVGQFPVSHFLWVTRDELHFYDLIISLNRLFSFEKQKCELLILGLSKAANPGIMLHVCLMLECLCQSAITVTEQITTDVTLTFKQRPTHKPSLYSAFSHLFDLAPLR